VRDFYSPSKVIPQSDEFNNVYSNYNLKFGKNNIDKSNISNNDSIKNKNGGKNNISVNGVKTISIDFRPSKTKTAMHHKLYESTMQNVKFYFKFMTLLE
jgi:hypothetical protein